MQQNLSVLQKGLILVSVPLVLELAFIAVLGLMLHSAELHAAREAKAKTTIAEANNLVKLYYDAASSLMLYAVTHSEQSMERYEKQLATADECLDLLRTLVKESPAAREKLAGIEKSHRHIGNLLTQARNTLQEGGRTMGLMRSVQLKNEVQSSVKEAMVSV